MKINCHKLNNGGVGLYSLSPRVLALFTGVGYEWSDAQIAGEIVNFMVPSGEGGPGYSEAIATEWMTALGRGGLSEEEAQDLLRRRMDDRHGYAASEVLEDTDLPSDRYFRDAWEWED